VTLFPTSFAKTQSVKPLKMNTTTNQINLSAETPFETNLTIAPASHKTFLRTLAIVGLLLVSVYTSNASFKTVVGGVTVSYSGTGTAYYDSNDGTLTVSIGSDGGSLAITVGPTANLNWGNYVDIYIVANNATLKAISIKGSLACVPYVCGEVWYVDKFALSNGVVGDTTYYGSDFGLGMGANSFPSSISLKNSYTTAQLFGFAN
jgi:hypothetical protein